MHTAIFQKQCQKQTLKKTLLNRGLTQLDATCRRTQSLSLTYTQLTVNVRATGNTELCTENTWYSSTRELSTQNSNSRAKSPRAEKQND